MQYQSRDQIPEKYRWDLSSMCADDKDFERQLEDAKALPGKLAAYKGRVSASAADLLAYLRLSDEANVTLSRLGNYADRCADVDTRVARYQVYSDQVMGLEVETQGACSWFSAELLGMADEKLAAFFAEEPDLEHYRRAIERELRMRPHRLSAAEEAILARAGDAAAQPERVFSQLNNADLTFADATDSKGERHSVSHGSFIGLERNHDRVLRKSAFDSVYASYGAHRNTCAGLLAAQVKQLKFFADSRRYKDALEYCLDANEVPTSVYDNLVDAVHRNLGALHNYASLRKDVLGVDELHFWDMYVPLVDSVDLTFTYEEAWDLILKALAPLGEDYLAIVRQGLEQRWIDVYETPGKRARGNLRAQCVGQVVLHLPNGILQRIEAAIDARIRTLLDVAVIHMVLDGDVQLDSHVIRCLGVKGHVLVLGHKAHVARDINKGKLHVKARSSKPVELA